MSWGGEAGAPFTYDEIVRELTEAWTSMDDNVHLLWLLLLNGCDLHKLEVALMRAGDAHGPPSSNPTLVLGSWGNTMRGAIRNKER